MLLKSGSTKPSDVFTQSVEPAYDAYRASAGDERLAEALAHAISAHLEWTFRYYERADKSRLAGSGTLDVYRKLLCARCPALQMMWDLARTTNHRFLSRNAGPIRKERDAARNILDGGHELFVSQYHQPFGPNLERAMKFWRNWPD